MKLHCGMPGCEKATARRSLPFCGTCWEPYKTLGNKRADWPEWLRFLANEREKEVYTAIRDSQRQTSLDLEFYQGRLEVDQIVLYKGGESAPKKEPAKKMANINSTDFQAMVLAFHQKFGCYIGQPGGPFDTEQIALGASLVQEEFHEFRDHMELYLLSGQDPQYLPKVVDDLGDILYTVLGMANRLGVNMAPIMAEIHGANMRKVGGGKNEKGKVLKPFGWKGPNIEGVLAKQAAAFQEAA